LQAAGEAEETEASLSDIADHGSAPHPALPAQCDGHRGRQRGESNERRDCPAGLFPTALAPAVSRVALSELMHRMRPQHPLLVRSQHRTNPVQAFVQRRRRIGNEDLDPLARKRCEPLLKLCRLICRYRHRDASASSFRRATARLPESIRTDMKRNCCLEAEGGTIIDRARPDLEAGVVLGAIQKLTGLRSLGRSPWHRGQSGNGCPYGIVGRRQR
jgi:hypothetical protein